jgi:hypothetical protein
MFMEDWQGCLSPDCQTALQSARTSVIRRGGCAITLEDFLLSMLDDIPELCRFLQRQGVDLDELTRTIQCEQPIVTAVASENLLSSQLMYWLHSAREVTGAVWLEWPELLQTLAQSTERLREKAYVAMLELVIRWPCQGVNRSGEEGCEESCEGSSEESVDKVDEVHRKAANASPVVMADADWLGLVENISVRLSASPDALIWIRGARGSGKSSWIRSLITALPGGAIEVDIRREADILASDQAAVPVSRDRASIAPALVLDNVSPADLMTMMASQFSVARELVTSFSGPVLLLGPDSPDARSAIEPLQRILGRCLDCFAMPPSSVGQKLAIMTAHQPMIEKRWRVELAPGVVEYVAAARDPSVASPGAMLRWVERAAARLSLFAERGPLNAVVLEGKADSVRRQSLLALARQQSTERLECSLEALAVERAASEVLWHERKRNGTLRLLLADDLRSELARRVAADDGSGQTIADLNQTGEP